jgi:hypothetical protein
MYETRITDTNFSNIIICISRLTTFRHVRQQVRNLDERVKIPALTTALRDIFGEFGDIVDIVAKKNLKAKGQAFVVFDSVDAAQDAIDALQGFDLFEKPMTLAFAKSRSDKTVEKEDGEEGLEAHKKQRLAEKGMLYNIVFAALLLHTITTRSKV